MLYRRISYRQITLHVIQNQIDQARWDL